MSSPSSRTGMWSASRVKVFLVITCSLYVKRGLRLAAGGHETETQSDNDSWGLRAGPVRPHAGSGLRPVGFAAFSRPGRNVYVSPSVVGFPKSLERISQLLSGGMRGFFPPDDASREYTCYLNHGLTVSSRCGTTTSGVTETQMTGTRVRTWHSSGGFTNPLLWKKWFHYISLTAIARSRPQINVCGTDQLNRT